MLLPVKHEREKHSLVMCDCICISLCVSIFKFVLRMCVHDITRSGEETRRLHESLDRMSRLCKNTMKEPKTESCQNLPHRKETLNVLSRGSTSTCGGGWPVINHTSQQNPREMPLFLVPAWCSESHQSYSVPSVRHKKGKQSLKSHEFLHLEKLYSTVRHSHLFQISMQMISSADHQCVSVWAQVCQQSWAHISVHMNACA